MTIGIWCRAAAISAATLTLTMAASAATVTLTMAAAAAAPLQGPQALAAKMSGTWVVNRGLSTGFTPLSRGRGREQPLAARQRPGPLFAVASPGQGRRGGAGGGGAPSDATDLTPEQRAQQAAMRQLEQIESRITIKASAGEVTFSDGHGERSYAISDKTSTLDVGGSPVKVKSKWDKQVLKQEFSNPQAKLVQTWTVDSADHLVMTAKLESLTVVTPEQKAVFDRQ